MTKQNKIHKYIRECQQLRKVTIRHNDRVGKPYKHHTRKWWKCWHKIYKAEQLKVGDKNDRTGSDRRN